MKTLCIPFLILSLLSGLPCLAQLQVGIKAGPSLSNIHYKQVESFGGNYIVLFYHGSLVAHLPLGKRFAFRPELLYSKEGWKSSRITSPGKSRQSLHYINLPLLVDFSPVKDFSLLLGPQVGWMARANGRADGNTTNITGRFKRFSLSLAIGAAYQINSRLGVELRYNHGLTPIISLPPRDGILSALVDDWYNRVGQVSVSYRVIKKGVNR